MNTPAGNGRRPYMRSMQGWWRRNTFYVEYMIHEATALFVAAYAVVLLVGLVRLSQGQAAWNAWLAALRSPGSVVFHVLVLAAISYHAWTWFQIMPRTLPPVMLKGKRLSAAAITRSGLAAAAIVTLMVFFLVRGLWA
ncbi:MAG: fumarate reductase subunit C [Gammaproteobacteria bacterium]|nr:fumarate reductase subunit C [Gammaproteobacteria bacterium]